MARVTGKGSFRGVPFLIEEDQSIEGGRRLVNHEYPLRNEGLVEDLGKKQRTYNVNCLVIGEDYLTQAEKLINALEADDKGTLKHPFWGEKEVFVESYSCVSSSSALRVSRFSITFSPALNAIAPDIAEDTLFGVLESYAKTLDALAEEFAEFCEDISVLIEAITNNSAFRLIDSAINFIDSSFQSITQVIGAGKTVRKKIRQIKNRLSNLMLQPKVLAKELQSLFALAVQPEVKGIHQRQPLVHYALAIHAVKNKKPTARLLTKTAVAQAATQIRVRTHQAQAQGGKLLKNDDMASVVNSFEMALSVLIQTTLLLHYGNAVASSLSTQVVQHRTTTSPFRLVSKQDAERYIAEFDQQLSHQALFFADNGFWNSYLELNQYRLALINDLRIRGARLKNSRQIELKETAPALVVLYTQTGRAKAWQQFCERNNVPHPLLVIGGTKLEVLDE